MDEESERKLIERVQLLEDQIALLKAGAGDEEPPETTTRKMIEFVETVDPRTLQTVLREIPKADWPAIFMGLPRKAIENLKLSVSKNSWKELVEVWREGYYSLRQPSEHQRFMRVVLQLLEMGEIVYDEPGSPPPVWTTPPHRTKEESETFWAQQKAQMDERQRESKAKADRWIYEELNGLV